MLLHRALFSIKLFTKRRFFRGAFCSAAAILPCTALGTSILHYSNSACAVNGKQSITTEAKRFDLTLNIVAPDKLKKMLL